MITPDPVPEAAVKKPFPWAVFGVPVGCALGVVLRNLAIGAAIGILLGGVASALQARRLGKKVSALVYAALGVSALAILGVILVQKR